MLFPDIWSHIKLVYVYVWVKVLESSKTFIGHENNIIQSESILDEMNTAL